MRNRTIKNQQLKYTISLLLFLASAMNAFAQKQTFDLTTFTPPNGWNKQEGKDAIQLSKEDKANGNFCLITLYKAVPGTADAKSNFDMAWASLVKEMVTVSTAPEMQSAATENGWETQTGHAPFESDGRKSVTDKWGNLLSSQNRPLEKVTYTFTKHYFSGIQVWNLVLQAGKATERDGPFSGNTTFSNAWYYAPISPNNPIIELPR